MNRVTRDEAFSLIATTETYALKLAAAVELEQRLADERAIVKDGAIRRLVESKAYGSFTAAEKFVEFDPEFMAHRQAERAAVADRIVWEAKLHAAQLRARLAVEMAAIDEQALDFDDDEEAVRHG